MKYKFTHLRLENWRNFRRVDIPLRERMFIVGPNASGKTNFLDAFRFLADIAKPKGSLAAAIEDRGGFGRIRSLHAHGQNSQVKIGIELRMAGASWGYELTLSGRKNAPAIVDQERVSQDGVEILARPLAADRDDARQREQTYLEQLTQNAEFRTLADALACVEHVHVVPQVAKNLMRSDDLALRDAPGSDFIERLAELPEKKRRGTLGKIEKLLVKAVPQFSKLDISREPKTGRPHLEASYKHWRKHGAKQNEREFSDGTLRLIGLLWAILRGESPLLLEEPELSLHETLVEQLPPILAKASIMRDRQVFVTTHAEKALNDPGIEPNEIVMLVPTADDTEARLAGCDRAVVAVAETELPLGPIVGQRTKPPNIEQLMLQFASGPE